MTKKNRQSKPMDIEPEVIEESKPMDIEPEVIEESVSPKVDDAVLLKVAHTHAGVRYEANTPICDIVNLSASAQGYMKTNNII